MDIKQSKTGDKGLNRGIPCEGWIWRISDPGHPARDQFSLWGHQVLERRRSWNRSPGKAVGLVSYTITHHTRQSAVGTAVYQRKPLVRRLSVTEYTMSEALLPLSMKDGKDRSQRRDLFLDEINCVSETLSAYDAAVSSKGKHLAIQKVPEGWVIVTAGNPPEYK